MSKEIKNLLPLILTQQNNWKFDLLNNWHTIFGPLSSKVYLEKIQEDTLILGVQDSCWLQELYLLSAMLLKTINQTLDQPRIKHLRFKTIGIKKEKKQNNHIKKERCVLPVTFSAYEDQALKEIKDPELQRALKDFLVRCYQEKA
jgi:hypothetical protein